MSEETKANNNSNNDTKDKIDPVKFLGDGLEKLFNPEPDNKNDDTGDDIKDGDNLESEDAEPKKGSDGDDSSEDDKLHDKPKSDEAEAEPEMEEIPQAQVDIARRLGFSDDEIVKMEPSRLERMIELYTQPKPVPQPEPKVVVTESKEPVKKVQLEHTKIEDFGDLEPETLTALKPFLTAHNKLIDAFNEANGKLDSLGERAAAQDTKAQTDRISQIDIFFDKVSKDIPEFGTSTNLTKDQQAARLETFGIAQILCQVRGLNENEALQEAAYLYGLSKLDVEKLEVQAEEKLKEKLNKQKSKMSPRPGGKKSPEAKKHGRQAAIEYLAEGLKGLNI